MAIMHYEDDAELSAITTKKVAIVGYGSQGHAHALNLKDSGVDVRVGLPASSKSRAKAEAAGLAVGSVGEVAEWCDLLAMLAPDTSQPAIWAEIAPRFGRGKTLLFAHGFNIRFKTIAPGADVDVVLVAPKGPGHRVRETFVLGQGVPALLAIHRDASGTAKKTALAYAMGIGATRAGVLETTFAEETETDLFGEQAVLCGGVSALVKAGFETLCEAGYQPEVAYFECMHELKLIVDLMYRGGLSYMRYSISDTAEWGDYVSGPRVVGDDAKRAMKSILAEIQSGEFAKKWIDENEKGRGQLERFRRAERDERIEHVGAALRENIPFLDPVKIAPGD